MIETKSVSIANEYEDTMARKMGYFGWTLKSSQQVDSSESHLEGGTFSDNVYSVTTHTKYVKQVYERDTKMDHYRELAALEDEYDALKFIPKKRKIRFTFITFLLCLPPMMFVTVPVLIINAIVVSSYNKKIAGPNKETSAKMEEIIGKAKAIVM